MMLAQIPQVEIWMLIGQLVMALGTLGTLVFMVLTFGKKQQVAFHQPVNVTITEELHKTFAGREEFHRHSEEVKANFVDVEKKRREDNSLIHEKINRVSNQVSALERDTVLQNQFLSRIDSKLDRAIERTK